MTDKSSGTARSTEGDATAVTGEGPRGRERYLCGHPAYVTTLCRREERQRAARLGAMLGMPGRFV